MEFVLKNKRLFAAAFWVWIAVILYFSLIPNSPKLNVVIKDQSFRLDYILHFLVYFSLAILYVLWKADNYFRIKPKYLIYFVTGALILSGISEYAQIYIPGRTFNPVDFFSNVAGITAGIIASKLVLK
ncbi:MAG: VanZ family protein [Bacteroidales bacterium]|nr:VanZ family protein [Bacteroidales bacterium]